MTEKCIFAAVEESLTQLKAAERAEKPSSESKSGRKPVFYPQDYRFSRKFNVTKSGELRSQSEIRYSSCLIQKKCRYRCLTSLIFMSFPFLS
eukprot:1385126-Amorphochlora_amoeboformis.AAC.2